MKTNLNETILILGISAKPDRYSHKAYKTFLDTGFDHLIGVAPKDPQLPRIKYYVSLADINEPVHTITVYINAQTSGDLKNSIVALKPQRIILNPGAENGELAQLAQQHGIDVVEACTLVMLRLNNF